MNKNLIRLSNAIKNTDTSKWSEVQKEHFNQLKAGYIRALNSRSTKNFNDQDLENLLRNTFEFEDNKLPYQTKPGESDYSIDNLNVKLRPLSKANDRLLTHELPNFKDIPKSNPYTHEKIPHYKSIVGFIIENGKTHVLVTNWTTTDRPVKNVIEGTKLGTPISHQHLNNLLSINDLHLNNYKKIYKGDLYKDIIKGESIKRDDCTWAAGEYGDKNLIPVGTTIIKGKIEMQYATLVVQKYALKDFGKHFTIDINNIPSSNFKEFILNEYKNEKSLSLFNPLTHTYEEINIDYINLIDPSKLTFELKDLQDPLKLEDAVFLANLEGKSVLDYSKQKGLWVDIDPLTQELIKENSEFNTLPRIEGPQGPDL